MGFLSRRRPAEPTPEEIEAVWAARIEEWHRLNPLHTWTVYYADADGDITDGRGEEVRAHRMELVGETPESVFVFHLTSPRRGPGYRVREPSVTPLIVPYARVHSINMEVGEEWNSSNSPT